MSGQRHVLVVATQCRTMPHLDRLDGAARELRDVLTDEHYGACRPGLPDGRAMVAGELEPHDIETLVRQAVEHAAGNAATLVIALLGHGFVPGDQPTLYLMGRDSREHVANTAVHVPALLAGAADRPGVAGLIAIVDTCNAAAAHVPAAALTSGVRQGRTRFDVLMAAAVQQSAIDFTMSYELAGLLRAGVGDAPVLTADMLGAVLIERVDEQSVALSRYAGESGTLWLGRNPRIAAESGIFGTYGYAKYRTAMTAVLGDEALPSVADASAALTAAGDPSSRDRAEKVLRGLSLVRRTVELLRRPPLRDVLTPEALQAASPVRLPAEFFTPGSASDAEVVGYLVLNPPIGEHGHSRLVRFVLALADRAGGAFDEPLLRKWIDELGVVVFANDVIARLRAKRAEPDLRLIVSLHSSLTGDWPEVVKAWLWLGDNEIDNYDHPCRPTAEDVKRAIVGALARAVELAGLRDLTLRRIEVAAPAALLLTWHPEEIKYLKRIGLDYDVVLHWSDRFKPSADIRYGNQLLRQRLGARRGAVAPPFDWLSDAQLRETAWLRDQLEVDGLGTAVAMACRPSDPEAVLTLLLMYTAIVIWPAGATAPGDPRTDLLDAWNQLPAGLLDAYRRNWRREPDANALAHLRAVWDDERWLDFCRDMQRRRSEEETQ